MPRAAIDPLPFSEDALAAVRDGMFAVTNEPGGTGYAWRINQPGYEMSGKTGTAQVRRITREERASGVRSNQQLPWRLRDHSLFVAYAPIVNPRYACSIIIEHGAIGHPNVEMVRDILLYAQQRDPLSMQTAYPVKAADNSPSRPRGGG